MPNVNALRLHATLRRHQAAEVDEVLERNILCVEGRGGHGRVEEPLSVNGQRKEVLKGQELRANLKHNKTAALETRQRRAHACYHRLVPVRAFHARCVAYLTPRGTPCGCIPFPVCTLHCSWETKKGKQRGNTRDTHGKHEGNKRETQGNNKGIC